MRTISGGAVSRAIRTPSRAERGFVNYGDPYPPIQAGVLTPVYGNPELGSEKIIAYELGYRATPHRRLTLDVALFYNVYDNLRSLAWLPIELIQSPIPHLEIPLELRNDLYAETYGSEWSVGWSPVDSWTEPIARPPP